MKWVVFRSDLDYVHFIFNNNTDPDLLFEQDVKNHLLHKICCIHRSVKLNRKFNIPLKKIWYSHYLQYDKISANEEIIFIFFEGCQMAIDSGFVNYLKSKYANSKYVYRYFNSITNYNIWSKPIVEKIYDLIVSMDMNDCKRFGWEYVPNTYPINVKPIEFYDESYSSDVFFIGREKGRLQQLLDVYDNLNSKGVNCIFLIAGLTDDEAIKMRRGIRSINYLPYNEVLKYVASTRCLLEITQSNQQGSTLRALEAIAFDRRFISNDQSLINNDYYNKENMMIYSDVQDIDSDFIFSTESIIYKEKELISNRRLLESISNALYK